MNELSGHFRLFIITIASEKGGVGKTTIATNLAIYLKAIDEDLPVTITSFDNHFTVDQMFAVGPKPTLNISDLLANSPASEVVVLGQYGVRYIASENQLRTPPYPPALMKSRLHSSGIDGILILDTRPILDWYTEAALLSSDLVIAPIKDRSALINAAKIQNVLNRVMKGKKLWLLPSLVDERSKFEDGLKVHHFLVSSAREQNYQVLDFHISKSPKVESLASSSSLRIHAILNKARNTAVHGQMKQLGEFVFRQYQPFVKTLDVRAQETTLKILSTLPVERRHRLTYKCLICSEDSLMGKGYFFYDLRSQGKGLLHQNCLESTLNSFGLTEHYNKYNLLLLMYNGPGIIDSDGSLSLHFFERNGKLVESRKLLPKESRSLLNIVENISGCKANEMYRELTFLKLEPVSIVKQLDEVKGTHFSHLRRKALKQLHSAGLI